MPDDDDPRAPDEVEYTDEQFVKVYESILDSSVWVGTQKHIKLVWVTMLFAKDPTSGNVMSSIPGLAQRSGCSIGEVIEALETFKLPDEYSRTKAHQGRRIVEIDGGWHIYNHRKYANRRTRRQVQNAKRQADFKARTRGQYGVSADAGSVTSVTGVTTNASNARSEILDPDPKDLERVPKDLSGNAHAIEGNAAQGAVTLSGARSYFVPAAWEPLARHRARCVELGLDLDEQVRRYREQEFDRPLSDWNRRFDRWLTDARKFAETEAFKRSQSGNGKPSQPDAVPQWQPESRLRELVERRGLPFDDLVLEYRREVLAKLIGKLPRDLDTHFVAWLRQRVAAPKPEGAPGAASTPARPASASK